MNQNNSIDDIDQLIRKVKKIDGAGYGASVNILGSYSYDNQVVLIIDRVPRDPGDPLPGKIKILIPYKELRYDKKIVMKNNLSIRASKHFFNSITHRTIRYEGHPWLWIDPPGQAFLERNSINFFEDYVEIRLDFYVPYKGRRKISGGRLRRLIIETIPRIINELRGSSKKKKNLGRMIETIEDQEYLRKKLSEEGILAFIADGSILPRRGDSDLPLRDAVPFKAPKKYSVIFNLPHHGQISGLYIERGKVISFAGANFHGKTTILTALSVAHYNYIPGDGREFVISIDELPLIAAENRRVIRGIDLSILMKKLPGKNIDTALFNTNEASGSTSQAASLLEALEFRVKGILIDEDSSAVNLLLRMKY